MLNKIRAIFYLSLLGTLFAGLVTARQFIAPATQPGIFSCVGFKILGYSPCPYGLALFTILTVLSFLTLKQTINHHYGSWLMRLFAVAGVIFSGWVGWREIGLPIITKGAYYWETFSMLAVPACVWGFLVFAAVAVLTFIYRPEPN